MAEFANSPGTGGGGGGGGGLVDSHCDLQLMELTLKNCLTWSLLDIRCG